MSILIGCLTIHLTKIDKRTNKPTYFQQKCRLSVGLLFPNNHIFEDYPQNSVQNKTVICYLLFLSRKVEC